MADSLFDLSLLICTRNRATQLAQTLEQSFGDSITIKVGAYCRRQ